MSKKEDDDKVKMSQREKMSMVVQEIKDRSKIRKHKVIEKQGGGDECDAREGNLGRTQGWAFMGVGEDLGKIQERSIDLGGSVFWSVGGEGGEGKRSRLER